MNPPMKEELSLQLESAFAEMIAWYEAQPDENFNKVFKEGKWTMAGHLYHLIKSTKGLLKGLQMPKMGLRVAFGKNNRPERTFDEQHQKYRKALSDYESKNGVQVIPPSDFTPEAGRQFEKQALLKRFKEEGENYCKALAKWSEKDLGVYVLPHPIMGKLTIREFTYFTIFHTKHHIDTLEENYKVVV